MNLCYTCLFACIFNSVFAGGDLQYPSSAIPDSLKENANAVIRNLSVEYECRPGGQITRRTSYAITVLNERGDRYATFVQAYNHFNPLLGITGKLYDRNGIQIYKTKASDIHDQSYIHDFSLFEDEKVKYAHVNSASYPYTVGWEYTQDYGSYVQIPPVVLQLDQHMSLQQAMVTLSINDPSALTYQCRNVTSVPTVTKDGGRTIFRWPFEPRRAFEFEPYSPQYDLPTLYFFNKNFQYGNVSGYAKDWNQLGKWFYSLLEGRDELPNSTTGEIARLVSDAKDDYEKIARVYNYLQEKTRYVSIQLGIGGYQPFPASTVDEVGYGDCKALSNYMRALLEAAGIKSYCAVVYGGFPPMNPDENFPGYDPFNHVILCVPFQQDTVWLECTSQHMPFNFLGDFTSQRKALLLTSSGGFLVNTAYYDYKFNCRNTKASVKISIDGNISAMVKSDFQGLHYDELMPQLMRSEKDQRESIVKELSLPNIDLKSISYKNFSPEKPRAEEQLTFDVTSYASRADARMFLPLNLIDKWTDIPPVNSRRLNPICQYKALLWNDTIMYELPGILEPEFLPEAVVINSKFGSYHAEVKFADGELVYIRTLKVNDGIFPQSDYESFREFNRQVTKADKVRISLLKNE